MSSEANKTVYRAIVQALNERRLEILDAHPGLTPMRPFFADLFTAWPDLQAEIRELIAEGEWVAVRMDQRGTHQGWWQGMPPTGRRAEWEVISTYRFAGGLIVEAHGQADAVGLRMQLEAPEAVGE